MYTTISCRMGDSFQPINRGSRLQYGFSNEVGAQNKMMGSEDMEKRRKQGVAEKKEESNEGIGMVVEGIGGWIIGKMLINEGLLRRDVQWEMGENENKNCERGEIEKKTVSEGRLKKKL